jgi:hypothetical protein
LTTTHVHMVKGKQPDLTCILVCAVPEENPSTVSKRPRDDMTRLTSQVACRGDSYETETRPDIHRERRRGKVGLSRDGYLIGLTFEPVPGSCRQSSLPTVATTTDALWMTRRECLSQMLHSSDCVFLAHIHNGTEQMHSAVDETSVWGIYQHDDPALPGGNGRQRQRQATSTSEQQGKKRRISF